MKKLLGALGLWAATTTGGTANAQSPSRTVSTKFYSESQDGIRTGCSIAFEAVYLDQVYRQGKPTVVDGSFSFINWPGKVPAVTLKILLTDANDDGETVPSAGRPATISLVRSNGESNIASIISDFPGEAPGSTLAAFKFDDSAVDILKGIASQHDLTVLFNREKGGIDNSLTIDLNAPEGENDENKNKSSTINDFIECTLGLTDQIKQKLGEK